MSWNEPGGDDKDPWSGRGDQKGPPNLDEIIRSLQEKLGSIFGGGGGERSTSGGTNKGVLFILGGILVLWLLSGFYVVDAGWKGVVTRFGKFVGETSAGLNWHIPAPIEQHELVNTEETRTLNIGFLSLGESGVRSEPKEALMLTKDENIVDVRLVVQYRVNNAKDFLFNVVDPVKTLKQVTQSGERGVIGGTDMDYVLTEGRSEIVDKIMKEIQEVMESYQAGIQVTSVNMQDAQAPEQVQSAFEDVIKAREDKQRLINEAEAYSNDVVPKARGAAARKLQEAEGYKQQVIAQAEGETSRFTKLLGEYKKEPGITRKRLYLETMESVLAEANTIMVDVKNSNNLLYLPIDKFNQLSSQETSRTIPENSKAESGSEAGKSAQPVIRSSMRGREPRGR